MSQTFFIQTYGCQMNYSDTERMETYLQALGFSKAKTYKTADLVIFNTCSIRQKAEDRVTGQMINMRRQKKKNPKTLVVITGCMVRKSSSRYSAERDRLFNIIDEMDIALRIEDLPKLASLIREMDPKSKIKPIPEEELTDYFKINAAHSSHQAKTQAFVAISNGCDKFCTYCIVPYSRGREKSRPLESILNECEKLVENGCLEITLIGQTVNSYGLSKADKESGLFKNLKTEPFVHLLREVDKLSKKGLKRLRFTSSHPQDMSDKLITAMSKLKTIMPYLHLPLQSGDDAVLKRMNRTYSTAKYRKIIQKLRQKMPKIAISTDVIVGFCGETDKEFETTYKFFKEMKFEHAYLAEYSDRRGTTAHRFMKDDISSKVKKQRWNRLNDLLREVSRKTLKKFLGKTVNVLVEEQKKGKCLGRSEHYKIVEFPSKKNLLGQIVPVKISDAREWILYGRYNE